MFFDFIEQNFLDIMYKKNISKTLFRKKLVTNQNIIEQNFLDVLYQYI